MPVTLDFPMMESRPQGLSWPRSRPLYIGSSWDGSQQTSAPAQIWVSEAHGGLLIDIDAPFHGEPPPPVSPGPTDRLWEFEVVELFLAGEPDATGRTPYTELEFGPWGHHFALRFLGRRNALDRAHALPFAARRGQDRWRGVAFVEDSLLPPGPWRGNAFAVHGPSTRRQHWVASPLPGEQPDFHQPEHFPWLFEDQPLDTP